MDRIVVRLWCPMIPQTWLVGRPVARVFRLMIPLAVVLLLRSLPIPVVLPVWMTRLFRAQRVTAMVMVSLLLLWPRQTMLRVRLSRVRRACLTAARPTRILVWSTSVSPVEIGGLLLLRCAVISTANTVHDTIRWLRRSLSAESVVCCSGVRRILRFRISSCDT